MFVFIKGTDGVSKTTNQPYQVLTLAQYVEVKGKVKCKIGDFFPKKPVRLEEFAFGDIVNADFEEPEFAGDFPKLLSIEMAYQSPYIDLLPKYEKAQSAAQ